MSSLADASTTCCSAPWLIDLSPAERALVPRRALALTAGGMVSVDPDLVEGVDVGESPAKSKATPSVKLTVELTSCGVMRPRFYPGRRHRAGPSLNNGQTLFPGDFKPFETM